MEDSISEAEMIIGYDSTEEKTYKIFRERT
jgi:hypothetical protein